MIPRLRSTRKRTSLTPRSANVFPDGGVGFAIDHLCGAHVFRFGALRSRAHLELHCLSFLQLVESHFLARARVEEDVRRSFDGDKTKTLVCFLLNSACRHVRERKKMKRRTCVRARGYTLLRSAQSKLKISGFVRGTSKRRPQVRPPSTLHEAALLCGGCLAG